ncbi:hypothetical protein CDD83_2031 [Cordyceps sp. RAO-2017]|nr:hypothetical protein CDD83_2031 [Cordyceps sp. RAO-2017]
MLLYSFFSVALLPADIYLCLASQAREAQLARAYACGLGRTPGATVGWAGSGDGKIQTEAAWPQSRERRDPSRPATALTTRLRRPGMSVPSSPRPVATSNALASEKRRLSATDGQL